MRQLADALPRPSAIGRRRLSQWLKGLVRTADGRALASLVEEHRKLSELLAGIAETAPYLWDLIEADPSRALRFFTSDPEQSLAGIVKVARTAARSARAPAKIARILRRAKADAALLIALTDTGGVWSVAQVTGALTQIADVTLGLAIQHLLRRSGGAQEIPAG